MLSNRDILRMYVAVGVFSECSECTGQFVVVLDKHGGFEPDTKWNKEIAITAGANISQDQKETKSLFGVNESHYASLWKL